MMKKPLLVPSIGALLLLCFFATSTTAQTLSWGVQGGLTYSNLRFGPPSSFKQVAKPDISLLAGGAVSLSLEKRFNEGKLAVGIEPGFALNSYGFPVVPSTEPGSHYRSNLYNVSVPLLFRVYPHSRIGFETGAFYSGNVFETINDKVVKSKNSLHRKNNAGVLGGVQFNIFKNWWLSARYSTGLTALFKVDTTDDEGAYLSTYSAYMQSAQLQVKYIF